MTFLQGGPEFEVTPLGIAPAVIKFIVSSCSCRPSLCFVSSMIK